MLAVRAAKTAAEAIDDLDGLRIWVSRPAPAARCAPSWRWPDRPRWWRQDGRAWPAPQHRAPRRARRAHCENVQKRYLCRVLCEPSPSDARLHGDESGSLELAENVAHNDRIHADASCQDVGCELVPVPKDVEAEQYMDSYGQPGRELHGPSFFLQTAYHVLVVMSHITTMEKMWPRLL